MWRVNVKAMREDPLGGELYAPGSDSYYRPVDGYLVFFDLVPSEHVVNVTAVERPH